MRWVSNVWCISNKKIGLESQNKRSCWSKHAMLCHASLRNSFHVHRKLVFPRAKPKYIPFILWVCVCVCMVVSVLSHSFCYLSCVPQPMCISSAANDSQTKQIHAPKSCFIFHSVAVACCCCFCLFRVTIERNVQKLTIFLKHEIQSHSNYKVLISMKCIIVCGSHLHVSRLFPFLFLLKISISTWIVLNSATGMHVPSI